MMLEKFITSGISWKRPVAPISRKNYRNHLLQFEEFLNSREKKATDNTVNEQDIADYIEHMQKRGFQPNTVAVKVAAVNSYFKWLEHTGSITYRPKTRSMPHHIGQHQKISDEILQRVLQGIATNTLKGARDVAMLSLIASCGFKTEEVVALNVGDVHLSKSMIATSKRTCYIGSVIDKLMQYQNLRPIGHVDEPNVIRSTINPDDPFFLNKHGKRISGRSLRRHLQTYLCSLDVQKFSTLDLQHTFKSKQLETAKI
jgi:site-specific recombinase XerD